MATKLFVALGLTLVAMSGFVMADEETQIETQRREFSRQFAHAKQLLEAGAEGEALRTLSTLMSESDALVAEYIEIGKMFEALSEPELALNAYSLELVRPQIVREAEARLGLGRVYLGMKRTRDALKELSGGVQVDPVNTDLLYNLGLASLAAARTDPSEGSRRARIEQAIKILDRAIRLEPEHANAYYERGMAKALLGDDSGARQDLNNAASLGNCRELADRLVELTVDFQTENEKLRAKNKVLSERVSALENQAQEQSQEKDDIGQALGSIAETLHDIRNLIQHQTAQQ